MVSIFGTDDVTAVTTWKPLLSEIMTMPDSNLVFDSSQIPGEIIDLLVVNTATLEANPKLGKALTGAWYEIMANMKGDDKKAEEARTQMARAAGTDLASFNSQLSSTEMFYEPADALKLTNSETLLKTMQNVAEFSFDHGLLGQGAPDAEVIGIEAPAGVFGDPANIRLRFDPAYMQMAADGKL